MVKILVTDKVGFLVKTITHQRRTFYNNNNFLYDKELIIVSSSVLKSEKINLQNNQKCQEYTKTN